MNTTIGAISTPLMTGGIGVVRVSGDEAVDICDRVFSGKRKLCNLSGYEAAFGCVIKSDEIIDECVALVFRAPHSYTGEDVVELSCHGGVYVIQQVLDAVLKAGATAAKPGEFTKRAFLNGKIDLTRAEAVADIISAQGKASLSAAVAMKEGTLYSLCTEVSEILKKILSSLCAWADFPDEDVPFVENGEIEEVLEKALDKLKKLTETYPGAAATKEGLKVAVAGKPNAGKSSLMNILCGKDRSIVTEIPGTTRDVVEDTAELGGVVLRLFDTAGIRDTDDRIEALGVIKSKTAISSADIVLFVSDGAAPLCDEDKEILSLIGDKPCLCIVNKTDLGTVVDDKSFYGKPTVYVSATTGEGLDNMISKIKDILSMYSFDPSSAYIANARQLECANRCISNLKQGLNDVQIGQTFDIITISIENGLQDLYLLTGEVASEEVIDQVFSRFCVGK